MQLGLCGRYENEQKEACKKQPLESSELEGAKNLAQFTLTDPRLQHMGTGSHFWPKMVIVAESFRVASHICVRYIFVLCESPMNQKCFALQAMQIVQLDLNPGTIIYVRF
jgi:hypothetical protein